MDSTIENLPTFEDDFNSYTVELKEGQLLGENKNYRLEKNLGAGGMGEVWLASEIRGGVEIRKVVVKTLRPDRRENEGAQAKALEQFRLIQSLNHTNICPIYVIEHDPACGYLIVMGYADGGSYADWFAEKPKSLTEVCDVLRPIADALDFAHRKGVIHRDVKPENMMFTLDGTPWLIDFGIAANLRSATQATTGQFSQSGTVSYMAPEQKNGELQTAQTDEYSLAMVALEFLAGSLSPLAFSRLAPAIQGILGKALSEKPAERYPTCRAFIDALSAGTALPASSNSTSKTASDDAGSVVPVQKSAFEQILKAERQAAEAKRKASPSEKKTTPAKVMPDNFKIWFTAFVVLVIGIWIFYDSRGVTSPSGTTLPASLKPGKEAGERKVLTVDGIDYAFRWCPPGEFMMGSTNGDSDEKPIHKVKLTKGFWLLETEVTQAMWQSVMGENPSWFKGDRNPVEQVSWNDCQEFCKKLSQKLGQQVQLPTEAQWEYACRAGTTGDYAGTLNEMAWYLNNSGGTTHAVGQKKPNAWGLYDMHGNVCEWCSDYDDEGYYSRSPTSDPENTTTSSGRVLRGGSWRYYAEDCRSASRNWFEPDYRRYILGLRVLLVPSPAE